MENKLITGLYADKPNDNAPEWVISKIAINEKFIEFFNQNKNEKGYLNIDILQAKGGKYYAKLNDYKPKEKTEEAPLSDPPF